PDTRLHERIGVDMWRPDLHPYRHARRWLQLPADYGYGGCQCHGCITPGKYGDCVRRRIGHRDGDGFYGGNPDFIRAVARQSHLAAGWDQCGQRLVYGWCGRQYAPQLQNPERPNIRLENRWSRRFEWRWTGGFHLATGSNQCGQCLVYG